MIYLNPHFLGFGALSVGTSVLLNQIPHCPPFTSIASCVKSVDLSSEGVKVSTPELAERGPVSKPDIR